MALPAYRGKNNNKDDRNDKSTNPDSKNSRVNRILIGGGVVAGIITLIIFLLKMYSSKNPCDRFADRINIFNRLIEYSSEADIGIRDSKNKYNMSGDTLALELRNISEEDSLAFFNNYRKKAMQKALSSIEFPINININKLLQIQQNSYDKNKLLNEEYFVNKILAPVEEIYSYEVNDICKMSYALRLRTPKDANLFFPKDLNQFIKNAIIKCPEFSRIRENSLERKINLADIYKCLKDDEDFYKDLKEKLTKYEKLFEYVDFGFPDLISKESNIYFASGEYKINGLYAMIISFILDSFEETIVKSGNKKYKIQAIGYTDTTPVTSIIPYFDGSGYSENLSPIIVGQEVNKIGDSITENFELSYARAYSAINYIMNNIDQDLVKRFDIDFEYVGKSTDSSNTSSELKRRVELLLTVVTNH